MSYVPKPADTREVILPDDLERLTEELARNTHEVWAAGRIAEGWTWGPERDDSRKQTPCLVPYEALPEAEKEFDRNTAMETLRLILKLGYSVCQKA